MNWLNNFWKNHGTKFLGFAQVTVAAVAGVSGVIPESQIKYWLAASGILTAWRGFFNSNQL